MVIFVRILWILKLVDRGFYALLFFFYNYFLVQELEQKLIYGVSKSWSRIRISPIWNTLNVKLSLDSYKREIRL